MNFRPVWVLVLVLSMLGCAPEPEGSVASKVAKQLAWSEGTISFDVEKQFLRVSEQRNFDIVSLVAARGDNGSLNCRVPKSISDSGRIWSDSSGNRWVRIGGRSKITYRRSDTRLEMSIDGVPVADCTASSGDDVTLNVLFDARPRPNGWSGEGMHGFEVPLPG